MPDTMTTLTRPNGKPFRPRKVVAHAVTDTDDLLSGVMVLGTHDIPRAQKLADQYIPYWLESGYTAADPLTGWWRDGFDCGQRRWIRDEEHGRAGVWFREVVEVSQ
jgi:hypothetical protein